MNWKERFVAFYMKCENNFYKTVSGMFSMRFLTWVVVTLMTRYDYIELTGMEYVTVTSMFVVTGVWKKVKEMQSGG